MVGGIGVVAIIDDLGHERTRDRRAQALGATRREVMLAIPGRAATLTLVGGVVGMVVGWGIRHPDAQLHARAGVRAAGIDSSWR